MAIEYTKKKRIVNAIALGVIKGLSLLTVAMLVLIIGYLIYRGVYKHERTESTVIPMNVMKQVDLEPHPLPVTILANKKSAIKNLSWFTLQDMALGKVSSLRRISSMDELFYMYVDEAAVDDLAAMLCISVEQVEASGAIIGPSEQILAQARRQDGSVVVLSDGFSQKIPSGFRRPEIETFVLAVNDTVTALYDNNRVGTLSGTQVAELLAGRTTNWEQLHGGDLPVHVLGSGLAEPESTLELLATTSGAVSLVPASAYYQATQRKLPVQLLKVERITRGPNITWAYLTEKTVESGKYGGILTIIGNTFVMVLLTVLIAGPLGIAAAVYLVEYARKGRLTSIIRAGIDVLAGIPSIIFGLFGLLVFVQLFKWSFSLISGTLTVALMILPTIVRTSEEAIRSVDRTLREASIGLGATRMETIWKVVLPAASSGITTGLILAIGRAVGETAALIYTIGSSTDFVRSLTSSSRVLAMHIYLTITEGQSFDKAFASALVLVVVVLTINFIARVLMTSSSRKQRGKDNG